LIDIHGTCFVSAPRPIPDIPVNTRWTLNGVTVAGGNEEGTKLNQLSQPWGLYVDDDLTVYIADYWNHRIVAWKCDATSGHVVAGGNGEGNRADQLNGPTDVIVDKRSDSLIISDRENGRVVLWPRRGGKSGKTIISNIQCFGLTVDDHGFLYVCDKEKHEVRRWRVGETHGIVVAGGNGEGDHLNQLNYPTYVFVDRDQSVHVSEYGNQRVTKWMKGAKEGIVVAGGRDQGNDLTQLSNPEGVVVDQLGTVYVAEWGNHRITRWPKRATHGSVIMGGNGEGKEPNQFYCPIGLSFDRHGNLYVVDLGNNRAQRFNIDRSC
jgi:sugar lactone lactonase YvrE